MNPDFAKDLKNIQELMAKVKNIKLENLQFAIPESVLFADETTEFNAVGAEYLRHLGKVAKGFNGKLVIEGYSYPGKKDYEFTLTRVVSVMAYLTANRWMAERRIKPRVENKYKRSIASKEKDKIIRFTFYR